MLFGKPPEHQVSKLEDMHGSASFVCPVVLKDKLYKNIDKEKGRKVENSRC